MNKRIFNFIPYERYNALERKVNKMPVKEARSMRRISSAEANSYPIVGTIGRVGNVISFLYNDRIVPVSPDTIHELRTKIINTKTPTKISAIGLSLSQISKITGTVTHGTRKNIYLRRRVGPGMALGRLQNYEIILTEGGEENETN